MTGNTVIDALQTTVKDDFIFQHEVLSKINFKKKVIVVKGVVYIHVEVLQ